MDGQDRPEKTELNGGEAHVALERPWVCSVNPSAAYTTLAMGSLLKFGA